MNPMRWHLSLLATLLVGALGPFQAAAQAPNSEWVCPSPTGNLLYQLDEPWTEGSKNLGFNRTITHIDGNWITVDAPLPQTFESKYGGGEIYRYTWNGIEQSGIEDIYGISDCTADTAYDDTGPHHKWSVGGLFDLVTVNGNSINVQNRGNLGSGHGWAGAYYTVWNSKAEAFRVRNPPTARNWLVGSIGNIGNIGNSWVPVGADPDVLFAAGHVVRPAQRPPHHRGGVPLDVGDRRTAPREVRIAVGADQ